MKLDCKKPKYMAAALVCGYSLHYEFCDSIDEAVAECYEYLGEWIESSRDAMENRTDPTAEEIGKWNSMLKTHRVWVEAYDSTKGRYDAVWEPTPDELESYGWCELS